MLDFSFGELGLIALVALIIVGPKDFPVIMRTIGRWCGKFKSITDEFRVGFRSAMQQSGMGDVETDLATIREEMNFIRDQNGHLQRVYDISDFIEEGKRAQMTPLPAKEIPLQTHSSAELSAPVNKVSS